MANLLSSLSTAGQALDVYQQALEVVQNNITNSTTPGYARQSLNIQALPFDSASGLAGGVAARGLDSSRDEYAEEEVRRQTQSLGSYQAQADGLSQVESLIDVTGNSGVSTSLDSLLQSFSAWSVTPSDSNARQMVIDNAGSFADTLSGLAKSMTATSGQIQNQIGSTVTQIDKLAGEIAHYNETAVSGTPNPGADANLHSALEQLSSLVNITTLAQADGKVNVLLGGGSPLVLGTTQYQISAGLGDNTGAPNPAGPRDSTILDAQGNDITSQVQGGQLGGYLDVRNNVLASLVGDGQQTGSLNVFAKAFADTVNGILTSGTTAAGSTGQAGVALFQYDASDPTLAASTFAVNPAATADLLAPVDSSGNANGNALALASLGDSTASGGVGGTTFDAYYSQMVAALGQQTSAAQTNQQSQQQVVAQAQSLRDQASGVSLDDQAVTLLQFQRSYQSVSEYLKTVNSMADSLLSILQ